MGDQPPWRNPGGWFLDIAIAVLAGIVALTIAVHLLAQILPWLTAIAGVAAVVWLMVFAVRVRGRRW